MSIFNDTQRTLLAADLNRKNVKTRRGAGRMTLSYIESWLAIAEANRIFGFDGWSRETVEMVKLYEAPTKMGPAMDESGEPLQQRDGWRVGYMAKSRITIEAGGERVIREGTGFGHGIDADLGAAHESAVKEAESDAGKRALMTFGNQFGLALYDKAQEHVSSDEPVRAQSGKTALKQPVPVVPPHDPETGEIGPHTIPLIQTERGPDFVRWGGSLVAAIAASKSRSETQDWEKKNAENMRKAEGKKALNSVRGAFEKAYAKFPTPPNGLDDLLTPDEASSVLR